MRPEKRSKILLGTTRSKAKMYEYLVPEKEHIKIPRDPSDLISLAIGILGDYAFKLNSNSNDQVNFDEVRDTIFFSAQFFDSYLQSHLNDEDRIYNLLMGSASYYLADLPGSSLVLAESIGEFTPDLECAGLDLLLHWLLKGKFLSTTDRIESEYSTYINDLIISFHNFSEKGEGQNKIFENATMLRNIIYENGTPREVLFIDIITAILKKRYKNSTWHSIPKYTNLSEDEWTSVLQKSTFIRELWPAQHLLGEHDIFNGKSAVVQMPTSAGKTKATEIIIRSAFLSDRTSFAIVVAPYRALCKEISTSLYLAFHNEGVSVDALSDVIQSDFDLTDFFKSKQILIVTPEKLIYILRQNPEIAENIGLMIFDEGHQFDSGTRGITYELLKFRSNIS